MCDQLQSRINQVDNCCALVLVKICIRCAFEANSNLFSWPGPSRGTVSSSQARRHDQFQIVFENQYFVSDSHAFSANVRYLR